jgi:hypothetical protein
VGDIRSQAATNRRFDPYQRRNWLASGLEQPKTAATTTHRLLKKSLIVASATHTPISAKLSNADFWLWERVIEPLYNGGISKFLSAMRIFGFGNNVSAKGLPQQPWFLSAMRIFGFGNPRPAALLPLPEPGFYPQCGFLALGT